MWQIQPVVQNNNNPFTQIGFIIVEKNRKKDRKYGK